MFLVVRPLGGMLAIRHLSNLSGRESRWFRSH